MGKEAEELRDEAAEAAEAKEQAAKESETAATDTEASDDDGEGEDAGEDKHGHPAISKGKYERDMKEKDDRIAELEAKVNEASKTEQAREDLTKEIEDLKAQMEADKVTHALELAGCRNVKAAKAVLEDFDGDVAKLKAEHPYLFEAKKSGSTGGKPAGSAAGDDDAIDRAFGLKK